MHALAQGCMRQISAGFHACAIRKPESIVRKADPPQPYGRHTTKRSTFSGTEWTKLRESEVLISMQCVGDDHYFGVNACDLAKFFYGSDL